MVVSLFVEEEGVVRGAVTQSNACRGTSMCNVPASLNSAFTVYTRWSKLVTKKGHPPLFDDSTFDMGPDSAAVAADG